MKVKLLQHFYTSSPTGLGKEPGFQTVAASKGISERDMLLLEQLSEYKPPDVSREESPKSFPPSYKVANFSQRYMLISRTMYQGRDFRNQPNNVLTQNLLITLKDFIALRGNAFSLFPVPGLFAEHAPAEPTAELPALEVEVQPVDNYQRLAAIPKLMPVETFVPLLNAAIYAMQRNRKLVIVPPSFRDAYEILESLLLCIPRKYRQWFTFSTYQREPYSKQMWVQMVPRDGDFSFSEADYKKYWVFNFPDSQFSPVEEKLAYVDTLAAYIYAGDPESVRRIVDLAELFDYHNMLDVVDHTVRFVQTEFDILQKGMTAALPELVALMGQQGNEHTQKRLLALRMPAYLLAAISRGEMDAMPWLAEQSIRYIGDKPDADAAMAFSYSIVTAINSLIERADMITASALMEKLTPLSPALRTQVLRSFNERFRTALPQVIGPRLSPHFDPSLLATHVQFLAALSHVHSSEIDVTPRPDSILVALAAVYRAQGDWLRHAWPQLKPLWLETSARNPDMATKSQNAVELQQLLAAVQLQEQLTPA
ncbi:MAG: GAP1-N2 domain-containing protein [Candidatus Xenobia bacterium]